MSLGECGDVDGHFVGCLFIFSRGEVWVWVFRGGLVLLVLGGLVVVVSRCVVKVVCVWVGG